QQSSNEAATTTPTSANTNSNSQQVASADNSTTKESSNANQQVASISTSGTEKHNKHKHLATKPDSTTTTAYDYVRPSSKKTTTRKVHYTQPEENSVAPIVSGNNNASETIVKKDANPVINSTQPTETDKTAEQNTNSILSANASAPNSAIDTTKKTQAVTATTDSIKKHDSTTTASAVATNNQQQPVQTPKYSHTLFSIDAGAGYSLGWMKAGAAQGSGISPILGISVTHYFSTNISALIGLQYNSLTNINTLYSNTSQQYDFGAVNNITSVTLKTLYYVALPIKFQYSINSNNIVSAGVNVLYLLNSNSNVVSYNQNYFGTSGYTSADKMGYMDGLNNLDAQLTLAYRRKIQRFTATLEGYYGLLDIENNSFFNNNVFERNSGLRIMISYDIIK
ncbi:MAG TPA: hypothetical protein VN922_00980, partial [Bacteroidia bacterium]|nr:hypothetical protein [Bacteroidia bacterium]